MENNENFVTETENVVETTEEAPKTYTQEDVDRMVKEKLDEVLPGKIARREAKIRKEYDRRYGGLEEVLTAGTGIEGVEKLTDTFRQHYESKGKQMPQKPNYSQQDLAVLARADADEIIRGGFEDVVEEANRLQALGVEKMTARDKAVFVALTDHIKSTETSRELGKLGVTEEVYGSKEFKDFAAKFSSKTPVTEIYDLYRKTQPKKEIKPMGSMKQGQSDTGVKDFYTPEEISRLTEEDLDDPKVWEAVRRSMTGG